MVHSKKCVTTRSPSATTPTYGPTRSSSIAARAWSTAAAQIWSGLAERRVVAGLITGHHLALPAACPTPGGVPTTQPGQHPTGVVPGGAAPRARPIGEDESMPVLRALGKIARVTATGVRGVGRGVRATATGTTRASRWVGRNVGTARRRSGAGNVGMMRLLDLHAASCAGDTLVTIGLAGTIFFAAPAGEARGRVALYLFVTMVPFALLAPVVGPVLDRFRHGRRYALSATMLGRALLAWLIADNIWGFGLYPAAFGVLALSRAYGVARSAAVPRLLPPGLGLSQAGARA